MSTGATTDQVQIDQVLASLQQRGLRYRLEEVVGLCPDLTWYQVFLAIDHLTKTGRVCLTLDDNSSYWVQAMVGP